MGSSSRSFDVHGLGNDRKHPDVQIDGFERRLLQALRALNVHVQNIIPADERRRCGRQAGKRHVHGDGTNAAYIITLRPGQRQMHQGFGLHGS
jgi:hypothetical protein